MKSVLIIYPSWEDRSYLGFKRYINEIELTGPVYLLKMNNSKHSLKTDLCINEIVNSAQERNISISNFLISNCDKDIHLIVKGLFEGIETQDKVYLDITTMSRNILWSLLFFLRQYKNNVTVIYSKPASYNGDWISREPSTPSLLIKHSGIFNLDLKTCLVIVTGFDTDRTKQLVKFYEPHKIILLVQEGCDFENDSRNNGNSHRDVCEEIGHIPTNIDVLSINSYSEDFGFSMIKSVVDKYKLDYNIILTSLGPKVSAISIYQIYIDNPEIGLSYIPCKEYNPDYCLGIGETIKKEIEL